MHSTFTKTNAVGILNLLIAMDSLIKIEREKWEWKKLQLACYFSFFALPFFFPFFLGITLSPFFLFVFLFVFFFLFARHSWTSKIILSHYKGYLCILFKKDGQRTLFKGK